MLSGRFVVLGGGHGTSAVAKALRTTAAELTLIVTIADDGGSSGVLRRRLGGPAVGDMRRSMIALSGEDTLVGRTLTRPLTLGRFGTHPLGNLVLHSLADAFGDLEAGAVWLEQQIGLDAQILPATIEPVSLLARTDDERVIRGESEIGRCTSPIRRLCFEPRYPASPCAAVTAIAEADCVLIAPGSLFTSTLATVALPDLAAALATTPATVVWLCNLAPGRGEGARLTGAEALAALRAHGVRVDAVLHDPDAPLHLTATDVDGEDVHVLAHSLRSAEPGVHDPDRLRVALDELLEPLELSAAG